MTKKLTRAALMTALAAAILCLSAWLPRGGLALGTFVDQKDRTQFLALMRRVLELRHIA